MARLLSWKENRFKFFLILFCILFFIAWIFILKSCLSRSTYYPKAYLSRHYSNAVKYYNEHLFASAVSKLIGILKIDPDYKDAYILLGDIYRNSGLYPEAIRQYLRAIKVDSMDKSSHYKLALAYWQMGNYTASAREFNFMLKNFNSDEIDLINNLASCYRNIGLYKPALEKYKKVLKLDPRHATAYYNIGTIYFTDYQDYKRAIKEWIKALRIDPEMEEARVYISNAKILLKEKHHAQKNRK